MDQHRLVISYKQTTTNYSRVGSLSLNKSSRLPSRDDAGGLIACTENVRLHVCQPRQKSSKPGRGRTATTHCRGGLFHLLCHRFDPKHRHPTYKYRKSTPTRGRSTHENKNKTRKQRFSTSDRSSTDGSSSSSRAPTLSS